jgi:hypothetical protein
LLLLIAGCATSRAQAPVLSWYPLEVGDSWIWANESLDGDRTHPSFERWTMEQTIVSAAPDAELGGTLVTRRNRVLNDVTSADFIQANNAARPVAPESHLLIFRNCLYILDGEEVGSAKIAPGYGHTRATYHEELLRGTVQPDFCFPLAVGMTWGRIPSRGLDPDFVWNVVSLNADPYGPPNGTTFRLTTRAGSGTFINRWFTKGIGVVQENSEHHGTYEEGRRRLLRATIGGKPRSFKLTPARTPPLSEFDCAGTKWQHFARSNGTSFENASACIAYAKASR